MGVARAGFVAVDFYDGAVMYDFAAHAIHLVDLDVTDQRRRDDDTTSSVAKMWFAMPCAGSACHARARGGARRSR